jgi:hypothetical protein
MRSQSSHGEREERELDSSRLVSLTFGVAAFLLQPRS